MKKITLLFICFLALQAGAQVTVKPGIRAGLNLATLTNTNADTKADFYVGGFVAIKLAKFYTLQPELTYTRQGAKGVRYTDYYYTDFDPIVSGTSQKTDYELQYISLAVMNKFNIIQGFHAIVGPSLDFKVGDNFKGYEADELIGVDVAINAGLGFTLPMGLTVEARYKIGLADIFGNNYNYNYNNDYYGNNNGNYDNVVLNSVIQLGVSYAF